MTIVWLLTIAIGLVLLFWIARVLVGYFADPLITGRLLYKKILKENDIYVNEATEAFIDREVERALTVAKLMTTSHVAMLNRMVESIEESAHLLVTVLLDVRENIHSKTISTWEKEYIEELKKFNLLP
jgi:hypothetical protein